jgi:hypothetical protein
MIQSKIGESKRTVLLCVSWAAFMAVRIVKLPFLPIQQAADA